MAGRWRYVFADLRSDQTVDELDVTGVRFDDRINQAGSFAGTVPLVPGLAARAREIREGRTVVYVYRGGQIYAGPYLLWTVTASGGRGTGSLSVQGATLESWLDRREIQGDINLVGADQLDIARALLTGAQAPDGADLGILPAGAAASGVVRDAVWYAAQNLTYGGKLAELAALADGFEYRIRGRVESGTRVREMVLGYPTIGQPDVQHVVASPGNVLTWTQTRDATRGATSFRARGASLPDDILGLNIALTSDRVERGDLLDNGWPRTDRSDDYSDETDLAALNSHATANAVAYGGSARILAATIRLPADGVSPATLGDRVRLVIRDDYFDGGQLSQAWRLIGLEITPAARGAGSDTAALVFSEDGALVYPEDISTILKSLRRR